MKSQQGQHPNYTIANAFTTDKQLPPTPTCTKPSCFFCTMTETDPSTRQAKIAQCFKEMPVRDDKEHVLVLSGLWKIAMTKPNDPEFPSLGIFDCMAKLIHRGVRDKDWLLRHQNIYIPYYAAHIIGSYTMNKAKFANKAVQSGVVLPLMHLLRGKISWVEQRVAIRALGHLASHEKTFEAIAAHETEIIDVATRIASSCLGEVYDKFVRVKESKRLKYHRNLITRGLGGLDFENRKAEEWASQLQCWSLFFLDCFARKGRALKLICKKDFLQVLCGMRGGLENSNSPGGIGLLRALCGTKTGRESIADLEEVLESICNVSRSSDDCQYIAIDCLLLLLKDPDTRYKVINIAAPVLVDLVEIRSIGRKAKVGQAITQCLLQDYHKVKYCKLNLKSQRAQEALEEIWDLKVEKEKRETLMSEEEIREKEVLASLLKQEGNKKFWAGDIEKAVLKYSEALGLCPLKFKKERIVLHSNKAQCHLLLRDPEAAISDTTRALCLSSLVNPHTKSLWRRSQAFDMKGLAKESLMDCLIFINGRIKSGKRKHAKIPYYAACMINKQMSATWLFAPAKSKRCSKDDEKAQQSNGQNQVNKIMTMMRREKRTSMPNNLEESNAWKKKKLGKARQKRKAVSEDDARMIHF